MGEKRGLVIYNPPFFCKNTLVCDKQSIEFTYETE